MGTLRARRPSSILGYRCIQLRYFANQSINSEKKNLKFPLIANTKGRLGTKYYNIMFQPGTTVPHNSEEHRVLMSINVPMTAMLTATAAIPCNRNSAAPDGGPMGTLDQLGLGNDIRPDDLSMYRREEDQELALRRKQRYEEGFETGLIIFRCIVIIMTIRAPIIRTSLNLSIGFINHVLRVVPKVTSIVRFKTPINLEHQNIDMTTTAMGEHAMILMLTTSSRTTVTESDGTTDLATRQMGLPRPRHFLKIG